MVSAAALLLAVASASAPAAIGVRDLVEITDLSGLAASPDGKWLAFRLETPSIARNAIELRWAVVPVDGSTPARIVAAGGVAVANGAGVVEDEPPVWLPDGSAFLVRATIDGMTQIWRIDPVRAEAAQLTREPGDVLGFSFDPATRSVTYVVGATRAESETAERAIRDRGARIDARVDLSVGVVGGVNRGSGPESVRMTGDWFDREALVARHRVRRLSSDGHGAEPVDVAGVVAERLLPRPQRPDPARVGAACRQVDCETGRVVAAVPVSGDDAMLVTVAKPGGRALHLLGGARNAKLIEQPGLLSGGRADATPCAVTAHLALCVAADAASPPRLVGISLVDGRLRELHAPNAALTPLLPARVERLRWRDAAGRSFTGLLFVPRSVAGAPPPSVVIQYYLCEGFVRGGVGDELPFQLLAARGIAGLCIDRAVIRRPRQDSAADYAVALSGIEAIVAELAKRGAIDPERVGMHGLSFGSEVAMWAARRSKLLKAVSISSGQIEPAMFWFHSYPGRDTPLRLEQVWGLPAPGHARWREIAPALDTEGIEAPLLMQLPESEARWSIELITKLARAGKPVEAYAFPDAGHIKFLPRQKQAVYERNLAWFGFWLGGQTVAEANEPGRAERWRAMRDAISAARSPSGPKARRRQAP